MAEQLPTWVILVLFEWSVLVPSDHEVWPLPLDEKFKSTECDCWFSSCSYWEKLYSVSCLFILSVHCNSFPVECGNGKVLFYENLISQLLLMCLYYLYKYLWSLGLIINKRKKMYTALNSLNVSALHMKGFCSLMILFGTF